MKFFALKYFVKYFMKYFKKYFKNFTMFFSGFTLTRLTFFYTSNITFHSFMHNAAP